jgi:hypothetical protein
VRIVGTGNSTGNGWNSYTEVEINWSWGEGIHDRTEECGFTVYPVPASERIFVGLPADMDRAVVRILDLAGREMDTRPVSCSGWFPVDRLASGLYVVSVTHRDGVFTKNILILHE